MKKMQFSSDICAANDHNLFNMKTHRLVKANYIGSIAAEFLTYDRNYKINSTLQG